MTKPKPKNPVQGDAPVIDREAEVLTPLPEGTDGLMPTQENDALQKRYIFDQKPGITSLDVMEISMMRIIGLLAPGLIVEPGALRTVVLGEDNFHRLSVQAQRQMREIPIDPPTPVAEPVAPEPVKH